MKVKELSCSANISWSLENEDPIYLACGTSAQQLDASFSNSSILKVYNLSPSNESLEMKCVASKDAPSKFNQIHWHGIQGHHSGVIVGGCENGGIYIYSAEKLKHNEESLLISIEGKHAGPVYALDFNHHKNNLLASGSSDCEIILWDVNNTSSPMSPGAKPNINADVSAIAWNRQVEHIMAATYNGRCVVYDLRKNTSIIQIAESISRIKACSINWHPTVATQLILCSNEDSSPVGQVWDLRFAAAPLKTLEGHQRGIMATSWCKSDPDLFITSGKDNKIYVWNPNNNCNDKLAEIVGEFPSYNQWSFDLAWCQKDPSLIASASVDGTVSVYSIIGAGLPPTQCNKFSAIADSFPGMEMPVEVPQTVKPQSIYLKRPPKWFPKRCGANFGFGGRLLSWNACDHTVSLSQVVTEPEFLSHSTKLEEALSKPDLQSFCKLKSLEAKDCNEKNLWDFIGASFEPDCRKSYMTLFGFSADQIAVKVRPTDSTISPDELVEKISRLGPNGQEGSISSLDASEQFEMIGSAYSNDRTPETEIEPNLDGLGSDPIDLSTGETAEGMIRYALLVGDDESAVQLCLQEKKHSLALILAANADLELFNKTRDKILKLEAEDGLSSIITSLVHRDLYSLVSRCKLSNWKEAFIAVLTYSSDDELPSLLDLLGDRFYKGGSVDEMNSAVFCYLCSGNMNKFINCLSKTNPAFSGTNSASLQNLVEIMVVLERALTAMGRPSNSKDTSLSNYLCKYAARLASQGALSTAVSYLNNPSEGEMAELRDRIYRSLGYPTGASLTSRKHTISTSSQLSSRRSSTPLSYQFTPPVQAQQQGIYGASQMYYNSTPTNPATNKPPSFMQPTAVVPPSFGATSSMGSPLQFQSPPSSQAIAPPPCSSTSSDFRRANTNARYIQEQPMVPTSIARITPAESFTPSTSLQQSNQVHPEFAKINPSSLVSTTPGTIGPPSLNMMPPLSNADSIEGIKNSVTPAADDPSVPRGWNDPPPLLPARKSKLRQKNTVGEFNAHQVPATMIPESTNQHFQGFSQPVQEVSPHVGVERMDKDGNETQKASIVKKPLPSEDQVIQEVFDRLREKGLQTTMNITAKQRLEDLKMKLDILYDKLRKGQIAGDTHKGLHQIVSAVKAGDYHSALQSHSATISSGNFAEMSMFMPAIKMLLTTCMQCQVFYN